MCSRFNNAFEYRAYALPVGAASGCLLATLSSATQFLAAVFHCQLALGAPIVAGACGASIYPPWSIVAWSLAWGRDFPKPFSAAVLLVVAGTSIATLAAAALWPRNAALRVWGRDAWAGHADAREAGLFSATGTILGKLDGEILCFDGSEHQVLIGASRSGKGRGQIVPTLMCWDASALVLDVKGELDSGDPRHGFPGTSGFRAEIGPVLRFAPTSLNSNGFNPLLEVRKGVNEVRDAQNIVESIVGGAPDERGPEQFWNSTAKVIITGVVIHVLYAEPLERKTLAVVREKLSELDATCDEMRRTLHRLKEPSRTPEVHPEVLHAAQSYLAGEERMRSGIKATAESFFGVFADPLVAANTARSDFRVGDLMCAERPVTLYLQPPPSDAQRLMPLMRLLINQVARSLMEDQSKDACGRPKNHRLLLPLDDNGLHYGDSRILLVWNRLIFPDGSGISLQQMMASDPAGAAGLSDQTDNHLGRLGGAVGL